MNPHNTKTLLASIILASALVGGAVAYTFFTLKVNSNVAVVANGYTITLYTDETLTTTLSSLDFGEIMDGASSCSEWVDVWIVFDDNPATQVYGHITTENLPEGLTLYGETYRFLAGIWSPIDVDNSDCDFGNDPLDDNYHPHLRFRIERADSTLGAFAFKTIFTIMDTSTIS